MRSLPIRSLLLAALLVLPGCWTHTPARPTARTTPTPLAKDAWPVRDPQAVRPLLEATPREVFTLRVVDGVDPATLSDDDRRSVEEPQYTITYKGIHANGLLRIYEEAPDPSPAVTVTVGKERKENVSFSEMLNALILGFSPNAHLMSSRTLDEAARRAQVLAKLTPPPDPQADTNLSIVRAPIPLPKVELVKSTSQLHLTYGLPLRIPPADPSKTPRGVIIHLHAIAGNDYEPQVIAELLRRGWVSIDIKTETSIDSPIDESTYPEIRSLTTELSQLSRKIYAPNPSKPKENWRAMQRRIESHPLYPRYQDVQKRLSKLSAGGFQAKTDADLPAIAKAIAREVDDGLAGAAYATEAVLEYIKQDRPDLQNIPVVIMGFSAGALATPTAALRVHDQVDAVVLIGGGCDLFRISQESAFTDGGLKIYSGDTKAPKATIDKIDKLYLKYSKLDPYHTAPLIADLPILQLHASTDTWVPYATGNMLYERLNRPERVTMRGGHEWLFYFLPVQATAIANWVEKTVAQHPPRRGEGRGGVGEPPERPSR